MLLKKLRIARTEERAAHPGVDPNQFCALSMSAALKAMNPRWGFVYKHYTWANKKTCCDGKNYMRCNHGNIMNAGAMGQLIRKKWGKPDKVWYTTYADKNWKYVTERTSREDIRRWLGVKKGIIYFATKKGKRSIKDPKGYHVDLTGPGEPGSFYYNSKVHTIWFWKLPS